MASSDEESFEVQDILDSRKVGRSIEYKVRWRGYGEEEDSWEPSKNLKHVKSLIDHYKELHKDKKNGKGSGRRKKGQKEVVEEEAEEEEEKEEEEKEADTKVTETTNTVSKSTADGTSTTTTSTTSVLQTQSSPESSPVITRRSTRTTKTTEVTRTLRSGGPVQAESKRGWTSRLPSLRFLKVTLCDLPICVVVACILVVAATFVFENQ